MAISRFSTSRLTQGLPKYQNAWDGISYSSDYELIASNVVGANVPSVTFSSIPSTYKSLQLRLMLRTASTQDYLYLLLNGSNVVARHAIYANGTAAFPLGATGATDMGAIPSSGFLSGGFSATLADINEYADTTKSKTVKYLGGYETGGSGTIIMGSTLWNNTAAINQITVGTFYGTNFASTSTMALYGLKG
jgi:hypothetical protein